VPLLRWGFLDEGDGGCKKNATGGMSLAGPNISMKALLEAGVHFGHRTRRWDPRMRQYIFTSRNGIHIIDLQQTLKAISQAYDAVRDVAARGELVLFVGTKRQAQETIQREAERCGMPYVNQRWLGGTLTNFVTIRKRIEALKQLEEREARGEFALLPKKQALAVSRELERLRRRFSGMRNMDKLPAMLFVVDVEREAIAVKEANRLGIPIVGVVDTNCNPEPIDYVIPSNDDAIRAISLVTSVIADAVLEGKRILEAVGVEEAPSLEEEEEFVHEALDVEELARAVLMPEFEIEEGAEVVGEFAPEDELIDEGAGYEEEPRSGAGHVDEEIEDESEDFV
jgi:small subunit ribosomal protein S2